jgi:three-Cys-motif partner protein
MLVTWFNDKNPEYVESLRQEIAAIPDIDNLRCRRTLTHKEVGTDIIGTLNKSKIPTLFFVDPWGYNGLSLELINSALENWGCDCIFFFNYNRINAALNNPVFRENMASLFGAERAEQLTQRLALLSIEDRELTIIEAISQALNEQGKRFVLPFRFKPTAKTSHHLIFVFQEYSWLYHYERHHGKGEFERSARTGYVRVQSCHERTTTTVSSCCDSG